MYTIYKLTSKTSRKSYIGQTKLNIKSRFKQHVEEANIKKSPYHIHRAIRKYGKEDFILEIIEDNISEDFINSKEIYHIKINNSYRSGYNMTIGGEGKKGYIMSKETKNKISISNKKTGKERYKKRNNKLKKNLGKDFAKIIGEKSSLTQKKNKKNLGVNNPNFKNEKLIIYNNEGIILKITNYELLKFCKKNNLPYRALIKSKESNGKYKLYMKSKPRNNEFLQYKGWYCIYESKIKYNETNIKQ